MRQLDTSRFKSAMIDAAILHAERLTENDSEPVAIHSVYWEKWEHAVRLLQISQRRKRRQTRLVAFIVAVTVAALAGCAWRYREKIAEFWVTAFEKYDIMESDIGVEVYPKIIEEVYYPTCMLNGYELDSVLQDLFKVRVEWIKDNESLIYMQMITETSDYVLDNEFGAYEIIQLDNYNILYYNYNGLQLYTWKTKYQFCLISSSILTDMELEKIIGGIQKFEENEEYK